MGLLGKILGIEDPVQSAHKIVDEINALEKQFEGLSREQLIEKTRKWQKEIRDLTQSHNAPSPPLKLRGGRGELFDKLEDYLNSILPAAFAAVREAAKRTLNQRHYDVQLIGGIMLHQGKIAEMKTGEGKTLAATNAVYLNALAGRGVHIVTVNDYLARRDASWMGQIYDYLGLSVGVIQHEIAFRYQRQSVDSQMDSSGVSVQLLELDVKNLVPCSRKEAYACDVTYGTNNEFGFDYLRDNMVPDSALKVQRELYYAIVDEVDSILIDEARTPLIISAPDTASTTQYYEFARLVENLVAGEDFKVDEKKKSATLTEPGIAKLEKILGIDNIYVEKGVTTVHHLEQALRAKTLFKRDRDYVVRNNNEVVIVDEFTGRLLPGRRYSEGLHQAIEAKEGVPVERESKTLATITFQNYFRLYPKLAGMTGTAVTEAEEFQKIYALDPIVIPTNRPMIRHDAEDAVFKNEAGKNQALGAEVKARFDRGQPVLLGTVSIEKNESLSKVLTEAGVPHQVLNAKNHEQEAKIIAQAGRIKGVTLATNIAGRGVDIILGGHPFDQQKAEQVKSLGGLHVIGTERHEARRIDNQLRGRSGRQGDPGSSQFFISLEDDLIRLFGGDRVQRLMTTIGVPDDMPIEHGLVSRVIESAQKKIEGLNFDIRKHVLEFDDVMNKQREVIYRIRDRVLKPDSDLKSEILKKIEVELTGLLQAAEQESEATDKKSRDLEMINRIFPLTQSDLSAALAADERAKHYFDLASKVYEAKEQKFSASVMRAMERAVVLNAIDTLWMEHLDTMDHLRSSVRLRGYAQQDPLIEFKKEGFSLFERLLAEIDKQIVYTIYKVELRVAPQQTQQAVRFAERGTGHEKIGRNDPCFCGSGKKYKKCGLLNTEEHKVNVQKAESRK
ncbi:MAG: preprotein translocase subunit SecA [Candidatus Doudnabacteria bacterium]|nr:preprotein translocase subunit SecA [Candidatus Doudnabacteria bacterium]